jgi:hypothetical protein
MQKLLTLSFICVLILGFMIPLKGQNMTSHQKSKIEKEVDSVFHTMIVAAENLDVEKLASGVDDRYKVGFITGGRYFAEFDTLLNNFKSNAKGITKQYITIQKEKITVISENIVLITAFGNTKVDVEMGNSFTVKFFWSFVYEKINNNWKVIQSHQSNIR